MKRFNIMDVEKMVKNRFYSGICEAPSLPPKLISVSLNRMRRFSSVGLLNRFSFRSVKKIIFVKEMLMVSKKVLSQQQYLTKIVLEKNQYLPHPTLDGYKQV